MTVTGQGGPSEMTKMFYFLTRMVIMQLHMFVKDY